MPYPVAPHAGEAERLRSTGKRLAKRDRDTGAKEGANGRNGEPFDVRACVSRAAS